jgi:hypothetical protein
MLNCDYSDTVRGAAEQNGGYRRLAERLGVTEADLMNWTSDYSAPTTETLLCLVSIFLEYTPASRESPANKRALEIHRILGRIPRTP